MLCEHGNIAPCVECDIEPLKAENEALRTRMAQLAEALESLLEMQDEDCRYDHQGYCQNHNLDHVDDGCRVARAKTAIAAHRKQGVMSNHTAGPWVIEKSPFEVYNADHGALTHHIVSDQIMIAALYAHHESHEARLIAAAPELLSLLKEARSTLEMWKDVAPAVSLCVDRSIAKATR